MKRLINPPVQNLLWLGGIACLGFAAWNVWELRQTEEHQFATSGVKVEIPDADELSIPGVRQYQQLVEAPLFWEARARPKPAPRPAPVQQVAVAEEPEVIEVELMPPMARLVGIIDLGKKKYALVRNETDSKTLYEGDSWEGWLVENINAERVLLSAGKQQAEVALIADFEAPKANKSMLASRQRQGQRKLNRRRQARQQASARQQQHYNRANQATGKTPAPVKVDEDIPTIGVPPTPQNQTGQQAEQPAPVMSIKEALEARQRLMASRWGDKDKK